ncbi:phage head-tail connector protein [Rapidithrix thailandica]|uniref:Phage head-tail connector protein n=1 Tax=Rapidithrix thailandica TaxID=413964 RepID=A0AAW9RWV8_9BACT
MYPKAVVIGSGPGSEPLSLEEAKAQLRIEDIFTVEDALIGSLITTGRQQVENYCEISLIETTWKAYYDTFPEVIELPKGKVLSLVEIKYFDEDNQETILPASAIDQDLNSRPALLRAVDSWPATYERMNAVEVTFTAGFGANASDIPEAIKQAIKLFVGAGYAHREDKRAANLLPRASELLIMPYRQMRF